MRLLSLLLALLFQGATEPAKSTLEGLVVRADSGAAIPGAEITLVKFTESPAATIQSNALLTVTSDAQGKFAFANLDPGMYRVFGVRNGFARGEYGQRSANSRGTPLRIGEAQQLKDVRLRLLPAGTVTGRITGDGGEPLTGFTVELLRITYDYSGSKVLRAALTARTDDRGEYRLFWITPGKYYVRVNPQTRVDEGEHQLAQQILLEAGRPGGPPPDGLEMAGVINMNQTFSRDGYVSTYYPNATERSGAQLVEISSGAELGGINLQLIRQPMGRIRGRVVNAAGQPSKVGTVTLRSREDVRFRGEVGIDSTFDIQNVTPGSYVLSASVGDGWASTTVQVAGTDINNIVLAVRPAVAVSGRVQPEGGGVPLQIPGWGRVHVILDPADGSLRGLSGRGRILADGTFSIEEVFSETFWVRLENGPANTYLKEAWTTGADLLTTPLVVSGEPVTLQLVVSTRTARLEGTVLDQRQQPAPSVQVTLVPDQPRGRRDLYRTTTTNSSGHFVLEELAPGDYKVFAWEDLEPYSYFDPEVLKQYEQAGTAVHIVEASSSNVNVRLIPSPAGITK